LIYYLDESGWKYKRVVEEGGEEKKKKKKKKGPGDQGITKNH